MSVGMFLGTMAKKPVIKQVVGAFKNKINSTLEPFKSGPSSADKANVGLGQILGGAEQAKNKVDTTPLQNLQIKMDTGFYGHNKVPGRKQDGSGFYKHSKKVGNTLF